MSRLFFPILALVALFFCVHLLSGFFGRPAGARPPYELNAPDARVDVDALRGRTKNQVLRLASPEDLAFLRGASVRELVEQVVEGNDRERRLAAAALGVSGVQDGVKPLIDAFEREKDVRTLATLARALAETGRSEAIEALIKTIREQKGVAAYEAYRALKETYGFSLGLDADAWERWFAATTAIRD